MNHHPHRGEIVPVLTREHQWRQDATVIALQDAVKQAERYLQEHPDRIEGLARDKLCSCGISIRACQCPLEQARASNAHRAG